MVSKATRRHCTDYEMGKAWWPTVDSRVRVTNTRQNVGLTENDGHEIGGQDIYRLKIDYITMQCAILFKTTAEYKSQQRSELDRPSVIVE